MENTSRDGEEDNHRLLWSQSAYLRLAQMKNARLHIYVEGQNQDRYYYSKVIAETLKSAQVEAEFHLARELRGLGEGKGRCLSFFNFLSQRAALCSELAGQFTYHLFLLDKDIDDEQGLTVASRHILYTVHYGVENHIIRESDLCDAIAAACSLDVDRVRRGIPDPGRWLDLCCESWKEWVALCILSKKTGSGISNYRIPSRVNSNPSAKASIESIDAQVSALAKNCSRTTDSIYQEFQDTIAQVTTYYASGQHDTVFKGKWYGRFVAEFIKALTGIEALNERALWAALASGVDANDPSSEVFREGVERLLGIKPKGQDTPVTAASTASEKVWTPVLDQSQSFVAD